MKQANAVDIEKIVPEWWPLNGDAMSIGEPAGNTLVLKRQGQIVVVACRPGRKTEWTVTIATTNCRRRDTAVRELSARELMLAFALNGPFGQTDTPRSVDAQKPNVYRRWKHFLVFDAPGASAGETPIPVYITEDIQNKIWRIINE